MAGHKAVLKHPWRMVQVTDERHQDCVSSPWPIIFIKHMIRLDCRSLIFTCLWARFQRPSLINVLELDIIWHLAALTPSAWYPVDITLLETLWRTRIFASRSPQRHLSEIPGIIGCSLTAFVWSAGTHQGNPKWNLRKHLWPNHQSLNSVIAFCKRWAKMHHRGYRKRRREGESPWRWKQYQRTEPSQQNEGTWQLPHDEYLTYIRPFWGSPIRTLSKDGGCYCLGLYCAKNLLYFQVIVNVPNFWIPDFNWVQNQEACQHIFWHKL